VGTEGERETVRRTLVRQKKIAARGTDVLASCMPAPAARQRSEVVSGKGVMHKPYHFRLVVSPMLSRNVRPPSKSYGWAHEKNEMKSRAKDPVV